MSEFQYYEFRAVDQPLSATHLKRLHGVSTRAAITPTSFINTYQWGDFKGDPDRLMEQMFDAFLYFANWGTRRFQVKLPNSLSDFNGIERYCVGPFVNVRVHRKSLIVEFEAEEIYEEYLTDDGDESWMRLMLPLREDLLRGDYRCLYLAWLRSVQEEEVEDDHLEPEIPAGLARDSTSLAAFRDFFDIDGDLLQAATTRVKSAAATARPEPTDAKVVEWIENLPAGEKNELILAAVRGTRPALGAELLRRIYTEYLPVRVDRLGAGRRTAGELRAAARALSDERNRDAALKREYARRRKEAEQAAARAAHLDHLAEREDKAWDETGELIATKRPNDYDRAVQLLVDLRDLAARDKSQSEFRIALRIVRGDHVNKPSLQRRLDAAGLPDDR